MPPTYSDYKILRTDSETIPKLLKLGYIPHGSPIAARYLDCTKIFQAFVLPVEKPSESKKIYESPEVENLIEKIQLTNNGYLFNPTGNEIALAKKFPDIFEYYHFSAPDNAFPHRISLK